MESINIFDTVELSNSRGIKVKGILINYHIREISKYSYSNAVLLINKSNKKTFQLKSKNGFCLCSFGSITNIIDIKISRMVIVEKTMVDKFYLNYLFKSEHPLKYYMYRLFNPQESLEDTSNE